MNGPRDREKTDAAFDEPQVTHLDWKRRDYQEAVEGIRRGYEDMKAGRTQPLDKVFRELREKHGLPCGDDLQNGSKGIE